MDKQNKNQNQDHKNVNPWKLPIIQEETDLQEYSFFGRICAKIKHWSHKRAIKRLKKQLRKSKQVKVKESRHG